MLFAVAVVVVDAAGVDGVVVVVVIFYAEYVDL